MAQDAVDPGFQIVPEFQAEAWMERIAPRIQRLAARHLYGAGLRGEALQETADDIVQIVAMKAMRTPELCVPQNARFCAETVRNAAIDWLRKYYRGGVPVPLVDEDGDPNDPECEMRTRGLPPSPSAETSWLAEVDAARWDRLTALEREFHQHARSSVAGRVRRDPALARRLRASAASRGIFFAVLRRDALLATLLQPSGRDVDDGATAEAAAVAARHGADPRTVRNRRSDWLRFLRELLADDLRSYRARAMALFPDLRPSRQGA